MNIPCNKDNLTHIPHVPGIYFFKDASGKVIYIGKAKDLRTRVGSYFQKNHTDLKVQTLLEEATHIDYLPTRSEIQALLLEAATVAYYQPKLNILLKDGQPFVYLAITKKDLPQLVITRNKKNLGVYFGPFINKQEARRVHRFLIRTFRLHLCKQKLEHGCLDYHVGLCAGNCKPGFDKQGYIFRLEMAQKLLHAKHTEIKDNIEHQIHEHCKKLEFESAQYLSQSLSSIESIVSILKEHFDPQKFSKKIFLKTAPVFYKAEKSPTLGKKLQEMLGLSCAPASIDCFDISHFQSQSIVGSCIRFVDGIPDPNNFRRFKIKTLMQQNDYAALQEIVQRRYRNPAHLPDLILIDGGKGQRSAIKELFSQTDLISLAKREERVFSDAHPEGVVLDIKTDVGKTLIALRDYAHHFAIDYHRADKRRNFAH